MSNPNPAGLLPQINQLNSYLNKRIDFIDTKLESNLQAINEKILLLSDKVNQLAGTSKLIDVLNKNFNNIIKDLGAVEAERHTANLDVVSPTLKFEIPAPSARHSSRPVGRLNSSGSRQQHQQQPPQSLQQTTVHPPPPQHTQSDGTRTWPKTWSLRLPAPQPNSAPSSPFMTNRFSFDFGTFPIERSASFSRMGPYQQNDMGVYQAQPPVQQQQQHNILLSTQQDLIVGNSHKRPPLKPRSKVNSLPVNASPYMLSMNASNLMTNASDPANGAATTDASSSAQPPVYFSTENDPAIDELRNATHLDINTLESMQQQMKKRRKSSKLTQGQTPSRGTPNMNKSAPGGQSQADDASATSVKNIPGSMILSNKKMSTPQYKLEKSLKSVQEIWQEYEYGLNDKPPLKYLEDNYGTKWRNETESRTFLRRKKIYEAIEKGKEKGFDEATIIEELEQLRTYTYFDAIKKKPLQWLYSNIPSKYT